MVVDFKFFHTAAAKLARANESSGKLNDKIKKTESEMARLLGAFLRLNEVLSQRDSADPKVVRIMDKKVEEVSETHNSLVELENEALGLKIQTKPENPKQG